LRPRPRQPALAAAPSGSSVLFAGQLPDVMARLDEVLAFRSAFAKLLAAIWAAASAASSAPGVVEGRVEPVEDARGE
jgi:hypothetical protein